MFLKNSNLDLSLDRGEAGQEAIHFSGSDCGKGMILDLGAREGFSLWSQVTF